MIPATAEAAPRARLESLYQEFKRLSERREQAAKAEQHARAEVEQVDLAGDPTKYRSPVRRWRNRVEQTRQIDRGLGENIRERQRLLRASQH